MNTDASVAAARLGVVRWVALGGYFSLLTLQLYWHGWWHPSVYFPTAMVLTVMAVPMLIPLRGLLHGRPKAHLWASFLMILYFMHGTVEAYVNADQRLPALLETGLSLAVFITAALYARWGQSTRS
jgi:uncharacterized membrane protein